VNCYKISQEEFERYTDIGHYDYADHFVDGDKKITLWMSDLTGGNFQTKKISTLSGMTHEREFDLRVKENYWGRHDPFKNVVSLTIPVITPKIAPNEIPNRLINRLISEFPGASIYAYAYAYGAAWDDSTVTQII